MTSKKSSHESNIQSDMIYYSACQKKRVRRKTDLRHVARGEARSKVSMPLMNLNERA